MDPRSPSEPTPKGGASLGENRLPVRVVRSRKRRRTVSARVVDGVAVIQVPSTMTAADEARYVDELRRKLEQDPSHPRHIITEQGMGYRFEI